MADYYTHFSVAVRLPGKRATAWALGELLRRRRRRQELIDASDDDGADAISIDFDSTVENGCLYITDNGATGNVEHVAEFLQALMKVGYVKDPVAVQWADSCSRPRPNSFTGGAVVVTPRKLYWFIVPDLVEKKLAALERGRTKA